MELLMIEIGMGLAFLHSEGLIYNNLLKENILVSSNLMQKTIIKTSKKKLFGKPTTTTSETTTESDYYANLFDFTRTFDRATEDRYYDGHIINLLHGKTALRAYEGTPGNRIKIDMRQDIFAYGALWLDMCFDKDLYEELTVYIKVEVQQKKKTITNLKKFLQSFLLAESFNHSKKMSHDDFCKNIDKVKLLALITEMMIAPDNDKQFLVLKVHKLHKILIKPDNIGSDMYNTEYERFKRMYPETHVG
eukprot:GHVR01155076.1.p1 GENE.GHVR01155076.1~~GHVR01155076.1.p1  ORF type:complete len:248 (+),score=33.41 GHVR01155076.1:582-1325(+)